MKPSKSLALALAVFGSLPTASKADESTFKAYGFADVQFVSQSLSQNNFLVLESAVDPNTKLYLDHLNTYLDWKPNSSVRMLAEIGFNRDAAQTYVPGIRVHADSVAIYNDIYQSNGAPTQAKILQLLGATQPGFSTLPESFQTHMADSVLQSTLGQMAAGAHQAVQTINSYPAAQDPSKRSKDHGISVIRAHADILIQDEVNVRVGKFITPSGIWNVDHGSPAILTVKQPYETNYIQIFPESQTGLQVFGHTSAGDHDLSYAGWLTTGRAGGGIQGQGDYAQDPENLDDWAVGTHLQADLAYLDGIRLGATFHTGTDRRFDEWFSPAVVSTSGNTDFAGATFTKTTTTYNRELCYGLDTKALWKGIILQGEWNHRQVLNLLANQAETNFDAEYVLVGYKVPLGKAYDATPYVMYENITWSDPANNPDFGLADIPMSGFSDYLVGVNFGIFGNVRLKLEYSYVQIHPVRLATGDLANTYTDSDLSVDQYAAQLSVGF